MRPRIYTYKITFEEVPYYYYGVKKEKYFNEEYCGSPIANKWCWELYTPKKQILEFFEYCDEGWLEANLVEDRLIKPFYQNDLFCLNESCGALISIDRRRRGGVTQSKINKEKGVGFYSMTKEERTNASRKGGIVNGYKMRELKKGIFGMSEEERFVASSKGGKIGSTTNKNNKVGIFALNKNELSENGKKGGTKASKKTNKQKWLCLKTGFITTSGPLTRYQKARNIDTSLRIRIA
jgi:general stress protein YciG